MFHIVPFPEIRFGAGAIGLLGEVLMERGIRRPLIVTDRGLVAHGVYDRLIATLPKDVSFATYGEIPENPTIAGIDAALETYRINNCDGVIALGGGSVLDSGKALRIAARQGGAVIDYLRDHSKIGPDVAPYITVPTTAGTGAEITFGGGIHPEENAPALALRSPYIKPDVAICDPEMTLTLPPRLTAATGMDALTHAVEGYLSTNRNAPVEAIALDAIRRVNLWVERAWRDGSDAEARSEMLMAALEGGMAIYMGLGPVHALSMAFSDSPLHHGTLVTVSMPAVMRFYNGMEDERLQGIAGAMGLVADADAGNRIADRTAELNAAMGLPATVREMGYDKTDVEHMIDAAAADKFNLPAPKVPTRADYEKIVPAVLGG